MNTAFGFAGKGTKNGSFYYICTLKENYRFHICNGENSLLVGSTLQLYKTKANRRGGSHALGRASLGGQEAPAREHRGTCPCYALPSALVSPFLTRRPLLPFPGRRGVHLWLSFPLSSVTKSD